MARTALVAVLALGYGLCAAALGLGTRVGLGTVSMTFLNRQLEALASREGTDFSPLRSAWEAGADVWILPFAGVGITWLHASGTTLGREPKAQAASALGIEARAVTPGSLFGWPLSGGVAIGGYLVTASGLVTGTGLAVGGEIGVEWRFLTWGPIQGAASLRWRYLPANSLYDERGKVNTRGQPGADFSGLCLGISVGWR